MESGLFCYFDNHEHLFCSEHQVIYHEPQTDEFVLVISYLECHERIERLVMCFSQPCEIIGKPTF